jgi:hypothetical protein
MWQGNLDLRLRAESPPVNEWSVIGSFGLDRHIRSGLDVRTALTSARPVEPQRSYHDDGVTPKELARPLMLRRERAQIATRSPDVT